ncbi:MAG TPA: DUF4388 domain-containing protein [Candidatus Polarisedimenticolaceae bacterium]|nr:DUF4388 domain-containing protein [Candidatus Polarisedimenticolaceae bacterium]
MQEARVRVSSAGTGGRLEGVSLPDLLWELCRAGKTGVLQLTRQGIRKSVYVKDGSIVFATSSDANDRLGELLLREGLVTLDQLEAAIARLGQGKRLGGLLVEAGHLTPDNLVRAVVRQVREIVLGLFAWEEGDYAFQEGPLPSEEVITLQVRTGEILLQGIGGIRSFARIRRSVGPPRTMYRLRQDPDVGQEIEAVTLSEGAVLLLGRLERGPERVEALCREMFLSNFEIYQTLWAFKVLGVIEEVCGDGAAQDGRLTFPDGLAGVLVHLCRTGVTGVLHVVRGTRERAFHLQSGVCVFATSNDIDDGLIAYLIRRGVISLRDREEVAKRVLSNKRVGTILLEMGVLDETDLRAMVREQLSEIVFDTVRWEDGEHVFVAGELPTFEDITLDETVEDLVAAGIRRVTAWTRVAAGCGAPDAVLELTPDYLTVLDRMRVGTDAFDVASVLKQPRSVREVCRATQLSSFRACQILWTLRLLGGVAFTTAEASASEDAAESAVASAAEAFSLAPEAEPAPIEVAEPPDDAVLQIAAEATRWIPDAAEETRVLPLAAGGNGAEVVHDLWRLAAEKAPDRPMRAEEPAEPPSSLPEESAEEISEQAPDRPAVEEPGSQDVPLEVTAEALDPPAEPTVGALAFSEVPPQAMEEVAAEDPGATMQLSRDQVEAALTQGAAQLAEPDTAAFDQTPLEVESHPEAVLERAASDQAPLPQEADGPDAAPAFEVEAPPLLDADISRFNARQRLLYRSIRAEVGAGAANFVRSCRIQPFAEAELSPDGTWDPEVVRRSSAAPEALDRLLEAQIERLTQHIGASRAQALRDQIRNL